MSTYQNAAAVRAFRIINILAENDRPLSLTEIADEIELPKQSVHRLLKQLEGASLITRTVPERYYECSAALRQMAINLLMSSGPAVARHAILEQLADKVGETCNLTISSGNGILYLDRVEVNWPETFHLDAGSRVPIHCTSSGKLMLSFLPKQQRDRLVDRLPLRSNTERTITNPDLLRHELSHIRRNRYSLNRGEFMAGMVGIAVPVMHHNRRICAAIAIQTPEKRHATEALSEFLPLLRQAAEKTAETFQ